ncbi:MAG TPA: hypothetical protein VK176_16725, partial [Phycisphaerales bacterium]|nr:hypothetical protein [Phycisphaerales bacterium]
MLESRLILLVLGGFLLTWGISLAARAAADRWVKRPRRTEVRRLGVRLACVAIPLGTLVAVLGVLLDWLWTGRPLGHDVGGAATLLSGFVLVVGAGVGIAGW